MIAAGNAVLDDLDVGVRFLEDDAWRRWEQDAYRALGVIGVREGRTGLVIPAFAGVELAEYLGRADVSDDTKQRAAQTSLRSLRAAHLTKLVWPDGVVRTFSHGDATVRNVIYDVIENRAQWIDFESLHDPKYDKIFRRADDLRAWLVSAWESWPDRDALADAIVNGYSDAPVITALAAELDRRGDDNLYHLAQGRMNARQRAEAAMALRRRMEAAGG